MWFLGMDVGTGGTRAVVVDADGTLISGASSEHAPFRTPHPGWPSRIPRTGGALHRNPSSWRWLQRPSHINPLLELD